MTFNFLGPGLTVNVEAKVKEQIILDSSGKILNCIKDSWSFQSSSLPTGGESSHSLSSKLRRVLA